LPINENEGDPRPAATVMSVSDAGGIHLLYAARDNGQIDLKP
jgi:hypothetical protein